MTNHKSTFYILILTLCVFAFLTSAQSNQKTLPKSVITAMASRETRHHHFLWHNIRENWNRLSPESQKEITDLGWAPPRPARRYDAENNSIAITDNNSGEDFLYMHRQMIAKVNKILADNHESYGKIKGFTTLPTPEDKDWPVPAEYIIPNATGRTATLKRWKTPEFYNNTIKAMEQNLTSPSELKKMTLGDLGSRIEVTLHGWYHLRLSAECPYGYRPTVVTGLPEIDKKWDDPKYDWLVDSYSSQVSPIFWKIHGWVDDRIEDWRKANGLSSIRWKGTWEGGPMSKVSFMWDKKEKGSSLRGHAHNAEAEEGTKVEEDVMQKLTSIFAKEGLDVSFADPVFLESPVEKPSRKNRRLGRKTDSRRRRL